MKRICGVLIAAGVLAVVTGCGDSSKSNDPKPADPNAPKLKQLTEGGAGAPKAAPPKDQGAAKTP